MQFRVVWKYAELKPYFDDKYIQPIINLSAAGKDSHKQYRKNKVSGFVSASVEALYFSKKAEDSIIPLNHNDIHCVLSPSMDEKPCSVSIVQLKH